MINNYTLKKVKAIFQDGTSEAIQFHLCNQDQWEYLALIKDNKVIALYKKSCTGEGKAVYKIPAYVKAAINYFNKNEFNEIIDYRKVS